MSRTVNEWLSRLRALPRNCKFAGHMDTYLRNHFVMGFDEDPLEIDVLKGGTNGNPRSACQNRDLNISKYFKRTGCQHEKEIYFLCGKKKPQKAMHSMC